MTRFTHFIGDVNYTRYDGCWIARNTDKYCEHNWYILEIQNCEYVGRDKTFKYWVCLSLVDINISEKKIDDIESYCTSDWHKNPDYVKAYDLYQYQGGDVIFEMYGNNYKKLLSDAKGYAKKYV
ncbi:hypothetical protein [Scytonema sp. NUACC26]|uniref:hypothetical protein n=1 Tax=Scytonema sp. NUACC26 TaxID=3140176 RepID=UPI0034DBFB31